jgi:hypothetical protein
MTYKIAKIALLGLFDSLAIMGKFGSVRQNTKTPIFGEIGVL